MLGHDPINLKNKLIVIFESLNLKIYLVDSYFVFMCSSRLSSSISTKLRTLSTSIADL